MATDAFMQPLARGGWAAARTTFRGAAGRCAAAVVVGGLCAVAGFVAGTQDARNVAPAVAGFAAAGAAGRASASGPQAVERARDALRSLGMRDVAFCDAGCAMRPVAAARRVATGRTQAVIVSAASADAAALVHDLRQAGSDAMVVLTSPADPIEVVRSLPRDERVWLAAPVDGSGPFRLAIVGRYGSLLD